MTDDPTPHPGLLVSVRDATEATTAVEGGADVIDVKEPRRGPLGAADAGVLAGVLRSVSGRRPVTAAGGELRDATRSRFRHEGHGLRPAVFKLGLAGMKGCDWAKPLLDLAGAAGLPIVAPVVYADHASACGPPPDLALRNTIEHRFPWLVIDTWDKQNGSLMDHLPPSKLQGLVAAGNAGGVQLVLAGSLSDETIHHAAAAGPALIGVRGAACARGRLGTITLERVSRVRSQIDRAGGGLATLAGSPPINHFPSKPE